MSVKLTVVYDNPTDPEAFEQHYKAVHVPLAQKVPNVRRAELSKVFPKVPRKRYRGYIRSRDDIVPRAVLRMSRRYCSRDGRFIRFGFDRNAQTRIPHSDETRSETRPRIKAT